MSTLKANKDKARFISNPISQDVADGDWVDHEVITKYKLPEITIDASTTESLLVSTDVITTGDKLKVLDGASMVERTAGPVTNVNNALDYMPTMTLATQDGFTVTTSSNVTGSEGYRVFDNSGIYNSYSNGWRTGTATNDGILPAILTIESSTSKAVYKYTISKHTMEDGTKPKIWTFEGSNNGLDWFVLDSRDTTSIGSHTEFLCTTVSSYNFHRFHITAVAYSAAWSTVNIAEIELFDTKYQAPITATDNIPTKAYFNKTIDTTLSAEATGKCLTSEREYITIDDSTASDGSNIVSNTELISGERIVVDGVDALGGTVTELGLVSSTDPFGDGNLKHKYELNTDLTDTLGTSDGIGATITHTTGGLGEFGEAAIFQANEYIDTGFKPSLTEFSISFFVKPTTASTLEGYCATMLLSGTDRQGFTIHQSSSQISCVVYDSAGGSSIDTGVTPDTVNYTHIVLTYSSGTTIVYVNGVNKGTVTQIITAYATNLTIGSYYGANTNNCLIGNIDQFEYYDRVLTPTEIGRLGTQELAYYMDITAHGLTTKPTVAYKKGGEDLTFVSSTTSEYVGTNPRSGLLTTGDTIQLDGATEVVTSNVVEGDGTDYNGANNSSTINAIEVHTSNIGNFGIVSASNKRLGTDYFHAVDALYGSALNERWASNDTTTAWFQYVFSDSKLINKYSIVSTTSGSYSIRTWELQASLSGLFGGEEVVLDSQSNITWSANERKTFTFTNNNKYMYYRLNITESNDTYMQIYDLVLTEVYVYSEYTATFDAQASAPTSAKVLDRSVTPTVASDTFDGTDTFTKTYNKVTKTARDVEYGFVADDNVEIVQLNINQNMEP